MEKKVAMAKDLTEMGWPLNAVNKMLALGFDTVPWGEEPLVNGTLVPITAVLDGGLNNPTGGLDPDGDGVEGNVNQPSNNNKPKKWNPAEMKTAREALAVLKR